jgi:hypothetical protein
MPWIPADLWRARRLASTNLPSHLVELQGRTKGGRHDDVAKHSISSRRRC